MPAQPRFASTRGCEGTCRALASYGCFLAACGFEYDGPAGVIGFSPRIGPDDFRSAFVTAEGWGGYEQSCAGGGLRGVLRVKYGKLRLAAWNFAPPESVRPARLTVMLNGKPAEGRLVMTDGGPQAVFPEELVLRAGDALEAVLE